MALQALSGSSQTPHKFGSLYARWHEIAMSNLRCYQSPYGKECSCAPQGIDRCLAENCTEQSDQRANAETGYSMSARERDSYRGTYQRFYQTEIVVYNSQFEQTHTCLHS